MAGKVDNIDYDTILQQHADEAAAQHEAEEAARNAPPAALSPDAATTYEDVNTQPASNPYHDLAQSMQQWQQPAPGPNPDRFNQGGVGDLSHVNDAPQMSTQGSNLEMAQQAPEAFNAMQGAMAGTGVQANMPAPLAPAVAPAALEPNPAPQDAGEQVAQEQAVNEMAAQQAAQRQAAQEAVQAKVQHEANIQKAADKKVAEQDTKAKDINWGNAIGQGIAVAMGEYGRYLTGGKENLAINAIDRAVKSKAEAAKLTSEETIAAKKAALEEAQIKINEAAQKSDSVLKKAQAAHFDAEVKTELNKVAAQQKLNALVSSGKGLTAEDLQFLPPAEAARMVAMPDGTYRRATSPASKKLADEAASAAQTGKTAIHQLIEFTDYFGNNPLKKLIDRPNIAEAENVQKALKGSMRTLLVGPGNVSTFEHKLMDDVIRDPTAIFSMGSANKAALKSLLHKVEASERRAYKTAGIPLPPSQNDINISKLRSVSPKMTEKDAEDLLIKTGKWVSE